MSTKLYPWQQEARDFLRLVQEMSLVKCRYNYSEACTHATLKVRVTVYPTDHEMREHSRREMCAPCADHLRKQPETTIHSIVPLAERCSRTACGEDKAVFRHSQTGKLYCAPCARRINEFNPGLVVKMDEDAILRWAAEKVSG